MISDADWKLIKLVLNVGAIALVGISFAVDLPVWWQAIGAVYIATVLILNLTKRNT